MALTPGTRIGQYAILSAIGAGGMGEVYRATDTNLGRAVAIKVLPGAFASDPERLARFEREARLLASLNHPGIAHLYGFERATLSNGASAHFLAMELVEGEDLAERLTRGPVPLDEALPIARQIAEALEAAHEQGIVHRDLKPANVKLRADGTVKVLDFGLAKAIDPNAGSSPGGGPTVSPAVMNSPTFTAAHGTQLGMILGTAAYMAPEQARGGTIDKRADIWAFGVVIYEMLAGRSLFAAGTVTDTLAAVLKAEIDFSLVPDSVPPAIRRLLRRCLERHPKRRLHDIADARVVIEDVLSGADEELEGAPTPGAAAATRWRRAPVGWLAALVAVGAIAGIAGYLTRGRGGEPVESMRLSIQLASNQELVNGQNSLLGFSPDGTTLVFTAREAGRQSLFRRILGERAATMIPGTEGGDGAFFSPDGRWIGFVSRGRMMKVAAEGGRPFPLGESRGTGGSTWLRDGTIVFAPVYSDGLFRVSADGGTPERLTTPDRASGELGHWWPDPLPGERKVLFTAFHTPVDTSRIGVLDLQSREVRWLVDGGFFARYAPTGHLLYAKGKRLYAMPFDAATATTTGPAVAVLDDLNVSQTSAYAQVAVSRRGTLAYGTESIGNPPRELAWIDRKGVVTTAVRDRRRFLSVTLSPDDRHAAVTIVDDSRDLWTYSFERGTLSRLTSGEGTEFNPIWWRDGRQLLYIVDRPPFDFYRLPVGAPDSGRPLWNETTTVDLVAPALSPDGRSLVYVRSEEQTGNNIYTRPIDGHEPPRAIRATRSDENNPSFSPDGQWVVYQSDETGRPEIYVEPFSGPGERIQVSRDGGVEPLWARNGEIFFRHDDESLVIPARIGIPFKFDLPRALFSFPIVSGGAHETRTYDVAADGARILAVTIPEASRPRQIEIVTDWTRELERLTSAGRR